MTDEATPREVGSHAGLGLAPERAAFERWCAASGHGTLDDMMMPLDRALKNLLWTAWKAAWGCQQASIDRLMLEHCPVEMTHEQMAAWASAQVAAPGFDEAALDAALKA